MYIPEYLKPVVPGVWQRKDIITSLSVYAGKQDINEAIAILKADKVHYEGLLRYVEKNMPELIGQYNNVFSPGGGSPKFEVTILKASEITVSDMIVYYYVKTYDEFKKLFAVGDKVNVRYVQNYFKEPFAAPQCDCVAFIHILEHSNSWEEVKQWINMQETDIVIYGPNIEAAKDENWVHFYNNAPVDHNVFFTVDAIVNEGRKAGYVCRALSYSDDMLVWMKRV